MPFDIAVQKVQFTLQGRMSVLWQRLDQVLDHRSQSASNLHTLGTTLAYFSECEMHEVFPIGRAENHEQLARFVQDFVGTQVLAAGFAQQTMKLIDRNDGGRRIIDGRRKSLEGDIDDDAECKSRVLFHCPLWSERNR